MDTALEYPVALTRDGLLERVLRLPETLVADDGTRHPAWAWGSWTAEDWATHLPGWRVLPIVDVPPATAPTETAEPLPESEWTVTEAAAVVAYRVTPKPADRLAAELAEARTAALARVNREAGAARARFVTVTTGQEGTYTAKEREAAAHAVDADPRPEAYPYLAAEARHTGQPLAIVAALVAETAKVWTLVNAEIEGLRRGAVVAIEAAATPDGIAGLFPIPWPTP